MFLGIDLSSHDVATALAGEDGAALLALRATRPVEGGSSAVWQVAMQTARETLMRGGLEPAQLRCVALAIDAPLNAQGTVLRGVNGQVLRGVERDGELAPNGRRGSLEAYCGGDSFVTRAACYGLTLKSAREIWEMAGSDFAARSLCDDYVRRLAQGLDSTLALLNPRHVVLGGGMALGLSETLLAPLRSIIRGFCAPAHSANIEIALSQLGQDAAVLGAVALATQHAPQHNVGQRS